MVDDVYKNAFKEVYEILQNTDEELLKKVSSKFIDFIKNNMNKDYQTNINNNMDIDKQILLPETEDILALIYRSYWASDEEKKEFTNKDKQELREIEENKKRKYGDGSDIFVRREIPNNNVLSNDLIVIPKENFIKKFFKKILGKFKNNY